MRRILKMSENPTGSRSARVWVGLLSVLILCLGATAANAASSVPPIVLSQLTWLGVLPQGGTLNGAVPAGQTFGVDSNGDVILGAAGGNGAGGVYEFNTQTGAAF